MASKRKRQSEYTPRRKKAKHTSQTEESATAVDQDDILEGDEHVWNAKSIIDETRHRYLIDWEDDPDSGKSYKPSWIYKFYRLKENDPSDEPQSSVTRALVSEWEVKKREKANRKLEGRSSRSRPSEGSIRGGRGTPLKPQRQSRRAALVIPDSSAATSHQDSNILAGDPCNEGRSAEHSEQQHKDTRTEDSFEKDQETPALKKTPTVELSQISHSKRLQYEFFAAVTSSSQTAESQPDPSVNIPQSSEDYQEPNLIPTGHGTEVIIPDSQSFSESSYHLQSTTRSLEIESHNHNLKSSSPPAEGEVNNKPRPDSLRIARAESEPGHPHSAEFSYLSAISRPYTLFGTQNASSSAPRGKESRQGNETDFSQFQPSAEGLSAIPIARPISAPPHFSVSQHYAADSSDCELTFQTQIPLAVACNSSQEPNTRQKSLHSTEVSSFPKEYQTSQSFEEIWQGGQGAARLEPATSQISTQSDISNVKEASHQFLDSQRSNHLDTSVLSQKDPNLIREPGLSQDHSNNSTQLSTSKHSFGWLTQISIENALPSIESACEVSSSLVPPPLSQLSETLERGLVFHTQNPLEHTMSTGTQTPTSMPTSSLRERLRAMRAKSASQRLNSAGLARSTNSPSATSENPSHAESGHSKTSSEVSDKPFFQSKTQPLDESLLPLRIPHDPHLPYKPSGLASHNDMPQVYSSTTVLDQPGLGRMEFIVPLPMNSRVRDQYRQTVCYYRDAILAFTGSEDDQPALIQKVSEMIDRVNKVTTHTDLDNPGSLTQQDVSLEDEARWAEHNSAKFEFLRYLFDAMRWQEKHVAILAAPGQILDIIEKFLRAHRIIFARPDHTDQIRRSDATAQGSLSVTLLPTGESGASAIVNSASLVVAFDNSFNVEDRQVQALRTHMINVGQMSPVISLIVANSAEHIDRCLSTSLKDTQRLRMLVSCVAKSRRKVGELPPQALEPAPAAAEVADYITLEAPSEEFWRIPPIGEIADVELSVESYQSDSSTQSLIPDSAEMRPDSSTPAISKRALEDDGNLETSKKAKLTDNLGTSVQATNNNVVYVTKGTQVDNADIKGRIARTFQEMLVKHEAETRMIKARLQENIDALTDLQYRFEDQNTENSSLRGERDVALAATATLDRRLVKVAADAEKVKEERDMLAAALVDARTALLNSRPEVAELEIARAESRQTAAEKVKLETRILSMTNELEFTRIQYQTASTAAAEASSERSALQEEIAVLKRKASGEAVKLRGMNFSQDSETHLSRIQELEQTLASREQLLKRKEEELKSQARQRGVATRASSLPRSPMPYSRAGSPAPALAGITTGKGGHPLRHG